MDDACRQSVNSNLWDTRGKTLGCDAGTYSHHKDKGKGNVFSHFDATLSSIT